jgi:carboxyl-terminal processing protease
MKLPASILLLLTSITSFSQTNVKAILDTVLIRAEQTSLYTATVNWDSIRAQVYRKAEHATTITELKPAFETLLNALRDHHGKIINAKDYSYLAWFTDNKNKRYIDKREFDQHVWKIVNDTALKFEYKVLAGNIGYLKIVGIGPNIDIEKESKKIREAVNTLAKQNVKGWIVDLRYNGGGNMHPMMAGIAPLVGDGVVGSLVNLNNDKLFDWEIKNANFVYSGYQAVTLPNTVKFKKQPRVAVLTSRWTVSSGEIVATTLKGRPNTRFFGETTGGYTTNNGWDIIGNEVILVISTGIYSDRNRTVYEQNIPVEVEIPFVVVPETEKDEGVIQAVKWLKEKK